MGKIGDKISQMSDNIKYLEKTPIIKGYYLVIGGGKIGTYFLQYAQKNGFPFVLVIDRDENAPAAREARVIKNDNELITLLKNRTSSVLAEEKIEKSRTEENNIKNNESETCFYKMDMSEVPSLFSSGIPEYIIPAVPCHAVAYMLADFLKFPASKPITGESTNESKPVSELLIKPQDPELISLFENLTAAFPEDVIAGSYPEQGMLFFSYAREGEICPDGCPGPKDRCPTFGRKKPETITDYAKKLAGKLPGWVFESHQMKPGIGGLKGMELKQNLLEIMEFVKELQEYAGEDKIKRVEERAFFIATTCTCHGVLNLFYVA